MKATMMITKELAMIFLITLTLAITINALDPLHLTPLIKNGNIDTAKQQSLVDGTGIFPNIELPRSYAGFLTVNSTLNNHMFFWFFPCESCASNNDRLLLWLNGGPTVSSMLGLLFGNGPVTCASMDGTDVEENPFRWSKFASILYIDNPVGVGYSYSESGGERYRQDDITRDLFNFLEQFFAMFPEYKSREFYLGGQSYAGKYIPHLADYIHKKRSDTPPTTELPLTGIYLAGPMFKPFEQILASGDYYYATGSISLGTFKELKNMTRKFVKSKQTVNAVGRVPAYINQMHARYNLSNLDWFWDEYRRLQQLHPNNATFTDLIYESYHPELNERSLIQDNFLPCKEGFADNCVESIMRSTVVRTAVHVNDLNNSLLINANYTLSDHTWILTDKFGAEFTSLDMGTRLATLMDNYKVLIYGGDLDQFLNSAGIENALDVVKWSKQSEYSSKPRSNWVSGSDKRVLGYYTVIGNFCRVVVRGAGHQVNHDQPETSSDMMKHFLTSGCISVSEI